MLCVPITDLVPLSLQNVTTPGQSSNGATVAFAELPRDTPSVQSGSNGQISVQRIGRDARLLTPNELLRYQHMFASNNQTQRRTGPEVSVPSTVPPDTVAQTPNTQSVRSSGTQTQVNLTGGRVQPQNPPRSAPSESSSSSQQAPSSSNGSGSQNFSIPMVYRENTYVLTSLSDTSGSGSNTVSSPSGGPIRNVNYIRANSVRLFNPLMRTARNNSTANPGTLAEIQSRLERQSEGLNNPNLSGDGSSSSVGNSMENMWRQRALMAWRLNLEMRRIISNNSNNNNSNSSGGGGAGNGSNSSF